MQVCSIGVAIADAAAPMLPTLRFVNAYVSIRSRMDSARQDGDTKRVCEGRLCYAIHACIRCTHNCRNGIEYIYGSENEI